MNSTKIAYIISRFPHLPETFILREIIELERRGMHVELYPLIIQKERVVHDEVGGWVERAQKLPWISWRILASNMQFILANPASYASLAWKVFSGNLSSPKFLFRALVMFPKVICMAELMQTEGVTHIHAHYATFPALAAWIINYITGIPYSFTVHAHDIFVDRTMLSLKAREASFIVAISNFNRQFLARHLGEWVLKKTHVVHCGIQPDVYKPVFKTNENKFEIVSTGSLQPYKGQRYLIEACTILARRGLDFRCRIIGGGELLNELKKIIARNKLIDKVELMGPQPQAIVTEILQEADCYVQPSVITPSGKMEGIPVALMEAMACTLPVVATQISGIPELVQPDRTGWLVPERDAQALADKIFLIASSPEQAQVIAKAGRKMILQEYDINSTIGVLFKLLNESASSIIM